jgi:hypothetical protein
MNRFHVACLTAVAVAGLGMAHQALAEIEIKVSDGVHTKLAMISALRVLQPFPARSAISTLKSRRGSVFRRSEPTLIRSSI